MARKRKAAARRSRVGLILAIVLGVSVPLVCGLSAVLLLRSPGRPANQATLAVAYSPEKEDLFTELVAEFNKSKVRLPNGRYAQVVASSVAPEEMVAAAVDGTYQAISPDSSIWLAELDRQWATRQGQQEGPPGAGLVGETARYMVSPVVIAMWLPVAQQMGYPARDLGWQDLLRTATEDPLFKWSHPSTNTASGLLATLAIFYAGAGVTRGLTQEMATTQSTIDYVSRLEKTVKHYGEGELAVMEQVAQQGRGYLDAFIVQEHWVIRHNATHRDALVAIYPREGTLWVDHPLALLEHPELTVDQRLIYEQFRRFLLGHDTQLRILKAGYRPTDLSVRLDSPDSPFTAASGVDPARPYTTLQVPSTSVVSVVRNVWQYTKRLTNIILIADVSGSMQGAKLRDAKVALRTFLEQVQGDQERVGLVAFSTRAREVVALSPLGVGRAGLNQGIDDLEAEGNTALLDAVNLAVTKLQDLNDRQRINAIVVMTDGKENASSTRLDALQDRLRQLNREGLPIIVFCVAYGGDADMQRLESISAATSGFTRRGELETIKNLYKTLSSYF